MLIRTFVATVALASVSLALSSTGPAAQGSQGRQVYDPPTAFACITDHGPRVWCDEPMRHYGNRTDAPVPLSERENRSGSNRK